MKPFHIPLVLGFGDVARVRIFNYGEFTRTTAPIVVSRGEVKCSLRAYGVVGRPGIQVEIQTASTREACWSTVASFPDVYDECYAFADVGGVSGLLRYVLSFGPLAKHLDGAYLLLDPAPQ